MKAGKHRPVPPDDALCGREVQAVALARKESAVKLEQMQDKPRCECGQAVLGVREDGVRLPCPAPKCPTRASRIDVQLLSVETAPGKHAAYVRRSGRLPSGAPLFWWEEGDKLDEVG